MSKDNGTKGSAKPEKSGSHNSVAGRSETATDRVGEAPVLNYTDQAWLDSTKAPHISEVDLTLTGQLVAEIAKFGGMEKTQASRLARILLPHIEQYADNHTQAVLASVIETINELPLLDKYDLHKDCDHTTDLGWGPGHNDGYFDAINQVREAIQAVREGK